MITAIERYVQNTYTPEGFYILFAAGFLPVPYLWKEVDEFRFATTWKTKLHDGGVKTIDHNQEIVPIEKIIDSAINHIPEVEYQLKQQILRNHQR